MTTVPLLERRDLSLKKENRPLANVEKISGGTQRGRSVGLRWGMGCEWKLPAVEPMKEERRKEAAASGEEGGQ